MKISYLFCLLLISLAIYSCSDDDSDLPAENPSEDTVNYFPLVIGNTWDYENVAMSPGEDDLVTSETLSVEGSTAGNFDLETNNPTTAGPVTSALSQGVLRKSDNQLIFTGALNFTVEGFPDFAIALNNAALYDSDASSGSVLYNENGSFQETIDGVPVTFNYKIETVMGDALNSYQVNGTSYSDVISSKIIVTLEIKAQLFFEVTILSEQQVLETDNYFAKDIGMIFSETDVNFDFIELSQNPIPLGDIQFDITQSLESYNVELE